jgi:hypothetical protein
MFCVWNMLRVVIRTVWGGGSGGLYRPSGWRVRVWGGGTER